MERNIGGKSNESYSWCIDQSSLKYSDHFSGIHTFVRLAAYSGGPLMAQQLF